MSDSLGFLISDVSRLMRRSFDARAREIGITRPQWRFLLTLSRNEGINQGGMAELIEVEPITLCRMVDRLQEAGLVERRSDPNDRRAWQLFLTAKATPLLDTLRGYGHTVLTDALEGLSRAEHNKLDDLLEHIRNNLSPRGEDQPGVRRHG